MTMNIEKWFEDVNRYDVVSEAIEFCDPALPKSIDAFEIEFSVSVPELRSIWLVADGESGGSEGIFGGFSLFSIEDSRDSIQNNFSILQDDKSFRELKFDTFLGKTSIFEIGWIPFAGLFNRNLLILDARDESSRSVFEWSLETGPDRLIGKSLFDFLESVRNQLLSHDDILDLDILKKLDG